MDSQGEKVTKLLFEVSAAFLSEVDAGMYSPLNLAYVGDTVFDLIVRTLLLSGGSRPVKELNKKASLIVCAGSQAKMYHHLENLLSEDEHAVMKRGRNAKTLTRAKNASVTDYRLATGIEALFGYLYLKGEMNRIIELYKICVEDEVN